MSAQSQSANGSPTALPVVVNRTDSEAARSYVQLQETVTHQALEIARLKENLSETKSALDAAQASQAEALAEAEAKGLEAGKASVSADHEALAKMAAETLTTGRAAFDKALTAANAYGAVLAETALQSVFADAETRTESLCALMASTTHRFGERTVLCARVSEADFPDIDDLHAKAPELSAANIALEFDPLLESGECEFDLIVGDAEVSLHQHWDQLSTVLKDIFADINAGSTA